MIVEGCNFEVTRAYGIIKYINYKVSARTCCFIMNLVNYYVVDNYMPLSLLSNMLN